MTNHIKDSFICGMMLFLVNLILGGFSFSPVLFIVAVLPGFIYGFVLCDFQRNDPTLSRLFFILLSGLLYILLTLSALMLLYKGDEVQLGFALASCIGSVILLLLCKAFINRFIVLSKALPVSILVGIVASIPPVLAIAIGDGENGEIKNERLVLFITLFIFPIWQTLFGWMITKYSNHPET